MAYSNAEAYDMLAVYFQSFENALFAEREYAEAWMTPSSDSFENQ